MTAPHADTMSDPQIAAMVAAVRSNDVAAAATLIDANPALRDRINDPLPGLDFDATLLQPAIKASNRAMIALLLGAGADINVATHWWAGGFGVLEYADAALVPFLLEHGATMTIHGAARLALQSDVERLLDADPSLVHARAGDGRMPLHYAATVEIAQLLLDRGADIDALDVDHESTSAQYLVREHPDVARYLVARGAHTDILMAAALGDSARVDAILDADPAAIETVVSERYFPRRNPRAGGSIYIWTLGANMSPHLLARELGHLELYDSLMDRSPLVLRIATACELGDERLCERLLAEGPIGAPLDDSMAIRLVAAAERNNTEAVQLFLHAGWPVDTRNPSGVTALHWAGFHGNPEMVRELLAHHPNLEAAEYQFNATPLGWARYGAEHGWNRPQGGHATAIDLLLAAGARDPASK